MMRAMTAALLALSFTGCTDPIVPPLLSLDGPTEMALSRVCTQNDGVRSAVENCLNADGERDIDLGTITEFAYVTNRLGNSLAVVSFQKSIPVIVDTARDVPGQTHIPVGSGPTQVAATRDGNFLIVYNEVDGDLSVVSEELRREVHRISLANGESFGLDPAELSLNAVSELYVVPDRMDETRDAVWLVFPERGEVAEVRWNFSCNEIDGVYVAGCNPVIADVVVETLYAFGPGVRPRYAALGPDGDMWLTFVDRAVAARLSTVGDAACIDGRTEKPCITAEAGLTFGCSDGLDNDGDGLVDAADPQCLTPDSAEGPGGVGRIAAVQCNDGLDNDGDGLTDGQDPGCLGTADDSEGGGLTATACSDGLDNDGDGLVDGDDDGCAPGAFWNDEQLLPACADGEDNDGDGQTDANDPQCLSALQNDEARRPACGDLVDNDGDGLIDEDDPDCSGPTGDDETTGCYDGVDNDEDGAVDFADPGCVSPTSPSEIAAPADCQDGVDNDGDGLVDYPEDPDCYRATGDGERQARVMEFGPIAVDPEGRYVYVIDRRASQVLVLDAPTATLLDPNNCRGDLAAADCRRRPWESAIGLPVRRLPSAIHARVIELEEEILEDGRVMTRKLHLANVATTTGLVYYAEAAQISTFDGEEIIDTRVRMGDFVAAEASVTGLTCSLSAQVRDYVRASREGPGDDIRCALTPELPHILSPQGACVPKSDADLDCICEDRADPQTCIIDKDRRTPVELLRRTTSRFDDDETAVPKTVSRIDEDIRDDFYIPNDAWTVTYEGTILQRADALVEPRVSGLIRTVSGDFCSGGVEAGDLLTIVSPVTPATTVAEGECDAFVDVDLTWRVTDVSANYLALAPIAVDDADAPALPEGIEARVDTVPLQRCFAAGLLIDVRPVETWVVRGRETGLVVNAGREGNACVPRLHDAEDYGFRAYSDQEFQNPWIRFHLEAGTLTPLRDFTLSFTTNRNFSSGSSSSLSAGPSPSQVTEFETTRARYIPIVDPGNNTIRVFNAANDRFLELLF
jgi:hypothetical protein